MVQFTFEQVLSIQAEQVPSFKEICSLINETIDDFIENAEGYLIGTISGILAVFFYVVRYNQMMIYVEDRVYKKIEK